MSSELFPYQGCDRKPRSLAKKKRPKIKKEREWVSHAKMLRDKNNSWLTISRICSEKFGQNISTNMVRYSIDERFREQNRRHSLNQTAQRQRLRAASDQQGDTNAP